MGTIGWPEILLIAVIVVLLFGARRLPEIGKGLGEGIRSFRSAMKGDDAGKEKNGPDSASGGPGK